MIKNTKKIIAISIDKKLLKKINTMPLNKSKLISQLLDAWLKSKKEDINV
jgi:metal-responsive CopG/Arc/MetJ family transcriptional regulator